MAVTEVISEIGLNDLVVKVGQIGLFLQALGIIVVCWIVFESIALFINFKRIREIHKIKLEMSRIESKIDKLLKKS